MARYQIPPDPRDPKSDPPEKRPRRLRQDAQEPIPWRWLGLGLVVTVISIGLALALVNALLARPPLETVSVEPTLIILTAPPSPIPSPTSPLPTPSPIPTFTPIPTPDTSVAPPEITVGFTPSWPTPMALASTCAAAPAPAMPKLMWWMKGRSFWSSAGQRQMRRIIGSGGSFQLDDGTEGWAVGEFCCLRRGHKDVTVQRLYEVMEANSLCAVGSSKMRSVT
ncbi:MAG: hypothetical protein IPJ90_22410 [Anaerolineaceae bacterium]|nr:hypothetical protein [Anaerolineaceae bacterium]